MSRVYKEVHLVLSLELYLELSVTYSDGGTLCQDDLNQTHTRRNIITIMMMSIMMIITNDRYKFKRYKKYFRQRIVEKITVLVYSSGQFLPRRSLLQVQAAEEN